MKNYNTILQISRCVTKMSEREFTDEIAWPIAMKFAQKIAADFGRPRTQVMDIAHTIRADLVDAWKDGKFGRGSIWDRFPFSLFRRRSYYVRFDIAADEKNGPHIPLITIFD